MSKTSTFQQIKTALLRALSDTAGRVAALAETVAGALENIGAGQVYFSDRETLQQKLDAGKLKGESPHGSLTIPTSGWGSDSTATYPKYYDIAVSGVTVNDRANVDLAPVSAGTATACGLCPACETLAGKVRIRAVSIPTASMTANYWIEKGV